YLRKRQSNLTQTSLHPLGLGNPAQHDMTYQSKPQCNDVVLATGKRFGGPRQGNVVTAQEEVGRSQSGLRHVNLVERIEPHGKQKLIKGGLVATKEHADPATVGPGSGELGV